ncbi:TonB-dependent receptor domain-containing protein [Winogradskyella endarachnes]|uniref:TonB-dependent receptor plug domain-containing protein n=1 Tax=Winogradskyella endarachnes TaxID=2681965 RepID=A0A6L6UEX0_9FLAO|nr:TonB-dependent receptor [Winogradskyella endarachnes]MUU79482.1 TonB-dependent receptor plug domain-containing protein [Winogradskyella endarachnes]
MSKKLLCLIFFILTIYFCSKTHSQEQQEKQSLAHILRDVEEKYNVKFSFETKTIEEIFISPLYPELSLQQAITQLQLVTKLNFKVLNDRFIAITPNNTLDVQNSIQLLEEVVVTNYLTKGLSKTNNGTIEADKKAFEILPGLIEPDVLQIVQNLPGIVSVDERISNINVRGGTNDQNLILYEGIRMYQSGHFFGLISAFNPYLSEGITISKNGTSAKFGNAVSSTIAIQNSDELSLKSSSGIGGNMLSVDGFTKLKLTKKTELQLALRRSFTDVLVSKTYDVYFDRIFRDSEFNTDNNSQLALNERFLFYDINAKFLYNIDNTTKLRVNFLNMYNDLDYKQVYITSENDLQETNSNLKQVSFGTSINYSKLLKPGLNLSSQIYYSNYDLDAKNNNITSNQTLEQENIVEDYGLRIDISNAVNKSLNVNVGYQFNEVGVTDFEDVTNPNFISLKKEIIRTHAIFGEVERYSKSKNTHVRFGARISYFDKLQELFIEPRFAFNQKLSEYFRLEVLGELKSQSISQVIDLQQDFLGVEKRRWQLANDTNNPLIKSQQISAGLSYNQNNLLISFEGYYKNVSNISAQSQGFQNQFQFSNDIGSYTIKGLDFLINKRINNFSTWLSYSFSKNNYHFENLYNGNAFPNTIDLQHVVNTSLTYSMGNFKIGFGINWHSGRPYTEPSITQDQSNFNIEYDTPNNSNLPSYFRTDISAIYNFKLSKGIKANIGASVWNIFNQTNIINRYYSLDEDGSVIKIDNRSLKITPNFSFRLNF